MRVCDDLQIVHDIMGSLWAETCEDGADWTQFKPLPIDLWCELYDPENGLQTAVVRFRQFNGTTLQMCLEMQEDYRKDYSKFAAGAIHEWIPANISKEYEKVIAMVPDRFRHVCLFCRRSGWEQEGTLKKAWKKDGISYNMNIYSKMIDEME